MTDRPHVLVVENESGAGPFLFEQWLRAAGVAVDLCRPHAGERLPGVVTEDGVIVLGGGMGAGDDHTASWLAPLRSLLAQAVNEGKAVLGICLGSQLLASACGGRVEPSRKGGELGLGTIELNDHGRRDRLFSGIASPVAAVQWHDDEVTRLPEGALLLASSERCEVQAYRIGDRAWGVQFHPEVTSAVLRGWADGETQLEAARQARLEEAIDEVAANETRLLESWRGFAERFAEVVSSRH
jgi:GMP synthase (glutamine-hydrolysing)